MTDLAASLGDIFAMSRRLSNPEADGTVKTHAFRAHLPWRTERLTECGKPANDHTVEHIELVKLQADYEAALPAGWHPHTSAPYCGTCIGNVTRCRRFSDDPVEVLEREITRNRINPGQLTIELRAIAQLIATHRDEFDTTLKRERTLAALR